MLIIGNNRWYAYIGAICGQSPKSHMYSINDYDSNGTRLVRVAVWFQELGLGYETDNPATAQQITKHVTSPTGASYTGQLKQGKKSFPFTMDITQIEAGWSIHFVVKNSAGVILHEFGDVPIAGSTVEISD